MKREINKDNIYMFQNMYKLSSKDTRLIFEAFRRMEFLGNDGRDENYNMLGLGTPSAYKSKLFTASFGEIPKVSNWYKLTNEGKRVMAEIKNYFKLPQKADRQKVNEMLFSL